MRASQVTRAVAAAKSVAASLGLTADEAIVLQDSNRVTLRLLPCDVLAQAAPVEHQVARFEIEIARRLAESGSPVAALEPRVDPRVYERDGFAVTLWTYYEPVVPLEAAVAVAVPVAVPALVPASVPVPPAGYAGALERLHAGMRTLDLPAPHFTDRVERAQRLAADRDRTPELADADRELLGGTLRDLRRTISGRGAPEQLLHGEPHPGNLLVTNNGPLFIDLETCCRGPVEFDLAHAPEAVGELYQGADQRLLRQCRILVLAMITTWRWDRDDQLPNGRRLGAEWLRELRTATGPASLHDHEGLLARRR